MMAIQMQWQLSKLGWQKKLLWKFNKTVLQPWIMRSEVIWKKIQSWFKNKNENNCLLYQKDELIIFPAHVWSIWKEWNARIFKSKTIGFRRCESEFSRLFRVESCLWEPTSGSSFGQGLCDLDSCYTPSWVN